MNKLYACLRTLASIGATALTIVACHPKAPTNEAKNKLHEDPFRADIIIAEGTIPAEQWGKGDQANTEYKVRISDVKYKPNATQTLRYRLSKDAGWAIVNDPETTPRLVVQHSPENGERIVYSLRIRYYSASGEEITSQFIYNEQDRIHQHFFMATQLGKDENGKDVEKLVQKFEGTPWDYRYADTKRLEDDNSEFMGDVNPIGLKGLISFKNVPGQRDLMLRLIHSGTSKYDHKGATSKFYRPSPTMAAQQNDIYIAIPIEIR